MVTRALIIPLLALTLAACSPRTLTAHPVELPRITRRDLRSETRSRDTLIIHDSIYIRVKGDTVWRDRIRTLRDIRTLTLRDTLLIRDSIPVPVEVLRTVPVEKPLRWHQKTLIYSGILLWLLVIARTALRIIKRKTPQK